MNNNIVCGYIGLKLSDNSANKLTNYCTNHKLPHVNENLHTTIIYDTQLVKNPVPIDDVYKYIHAKLPIYATVRDWGIFGEEDGEYRGPVLIVTSSIINTIHDYCINEFGYHKSLKYDEYHPHISLCYGISDETSMNFLKDITLAPLNRLLIEYNDVIIEPIKT